MADVQKNGLAIAALVAGILGFLTVWIPIVGLVIAAVAVILGVKGKRKAQQLGGKEKNMAVAGLILGIVAAVGNILAIVVVMVMLPYQGAADAVDASPETSFNAPFPNTGAATATEIDEDAVRGSDVEVRVRLANNAGSNVELSSSDPYGTGPCSEVEFSAEPSEPAQGEEFTATWTCLGAGDELDDGVLGAKLGFTYEKDGEVREHSGYVIQEVG